MEIAEIGEIVKNVPEIDFKNWFSQAFSFVFRKISGSDSVSRARVLRLPDRQMQDHVSGRQQRYFFLF
jgi:hypothetical protein